MSIRPHIALALSVFTPAALAGARAPEPPKGVALVELFSSEGCSSCPPADDALAAIHARARAENRPVFTLAFHVDYWNKLGWPDRFSAPAFTARQRAYAAALRTDGLYTPQMVVNGSAELVGSDRARADRAIDQALAVPVLVTPTVTLADRKPGGPLVVTAKVAAAPAGAVVCAALAEDHLATDITAGENKGLHAKHDAVVRAFATAPIDADHPATLTLTPPAGLNEANTSIVLFVQDKETLHVLGAVALPVSDTAAKPAPAPTDPAKPAAPVAEYPQAIPAPAAPAPTPVSPPAPQPSSQPMPR